MTYILWTLIDPRRGPRGSRDVTVPGVGGIRATQGSSGGFVRAPTPISLTSVGQFAVLGMGVRRDVRNYHRGFEFSSYCRAACVQDESHPGPRGPLPSTPAAGDRPCRPGGSLPTNDQFWEGLCARRLPSTHLPTPSSQSEMRRSSSPFVDESGTDPVATRSITLRQGQG